MQQASPTYEKWPLLCWILFYSLILYSLIFLISQVSLLRLAVDSAFWVERNSIPLADNDQYFSEFVFPYFLISCSQFFLISEFMSFLSLKVDFAFWAGIRPITLAQSYYPEILKPWFLNKPAESQSWVCILG